MKKRYLQYHSNDTLVEFEIGILQFGTPFMARLLVCCVLALC